MLMNRLTRTRVLGDIFSQVETPWYPLRLHCAQQSSQRFWTLPWCACSNQDCVRERIVHLPQTSRGTWKFLRKVSWGVLREVHLPSPKWIESDRLILCWSFCFWWLALLNVKELLGLLVGVKNRDFLFHRVSSFANSKSIHAYRETEIWRTCLGIHTA